MVRSLLEAARSTRSDAVAALAIGAASHASIDRSLHPLVNALARRSVAEGTMGHRTHADAHREVEKFQSSLFHEDYLGGPFMGRAAVVRLVAVPVRGLARDRVVAAA